VERGGGTLNGGYMLGNIVSSPDASAGTLLASCAVYAAGIPGGLFMALLVYIGNRICYDPGYAGTTGCVTATFIVYGFTQMGFLATDFIAGMVIAILTIQGVSHVHASWLRAIASCQTCSPPRGMKVRSGQPCQGALPVPCFPKGPRRSSIAVASSAIRSRILSPLGRS